MPRENSKTVKQEENGDEDDEKTIASLAKRSNKSPNNGNGTPKSRPKIKKEENKVKKDEEDEDFEKPTSTGALKKIDNKGKMAKMKKEEEEEEEEEEEKKTGKMKKKGGKASESKDVKKREKKVFDLPGQKRDPPEEREPLRIFYETLYNQVPDSEIASTWMMESGLLPKEEAKKVFDRKMKKDQKQKLGSPMKTVVTVKRKADSVTIEKRSAKSPISTCTRKKKTTTTPPSKTASQPSRKRKSKDQSEDNDTDDFITDVKKSKEKKKQRVS
ncbi:hypothetical protein OROGR_026376 [Orobanche gracilis]